METRTFTEMIRKTAMKNVGTLQTVKTILNAFIETAREELVEGNEIKLPGLGTFKIVSVEPRPEREGIINPSTGERGMLPATREYSKIKFAVSPKLRQELKERTIK